MRSIAILVPQIKTNRLDFIEREKVEQQGIIAQWFQLLLSNPPSRQKYSYT